MENTDHELNAATENIETHPWKKNIVKDPDAPAYYSQQAVLGFSMFFTVIFGAVLLASNVENRKNKWIVIGFGLLYTSAAILMLNFLPRSTALTIGVNGLGALVLTQLFWNKYIGLQTRFRAKPIWKPLIISIIITIPFLIALFYGTPE
jgi:hypothetical protein